MMMKRLTAISLAGLVLAGCSDGGTVPPENEDALALVSEATTVEAAHGGSHQTLLRRLVQGVREEGDADALAMLEEAAALRDDAIAARESGDQEAARELWRRAQRLLLGAVVSTFPDALDRIGNMVDDMLSRMTEKLGDRDAPKIRKVLRFASQLRSRANGAAEAGQPVAALRFNLTAAHLLQRLVHHMRQGPDSAEDDEAQESAGTL